MTRRTDSLRTTVTRALDERGLLYHPADDSVFVCRAAGNRAAYDLVVHVDEALEQVGCLCTYSFRAADDRRLALAEAITRANYGLRLGSFDLDFTDGELRFRIAVDVEGGLFAEAMLHNMVGLSLAMCDRYHDAFAGVVYGGLEPAAAIAIADVLVPDEAATGATDTDDAFEPDDSDPMLQRPIDNSYPFPWREPDAGFAGHYPGAVDPEEARAKLGAILDAGVTSFIDLTEEGERTWTGPMLPYADLLHAEAARRGIAVEYQRFPIRDRSVPRSSRALAAILDAIDAALAQGRRVYVHCWGGKGRTGTVVACHLVRHGRDAEDALATVQALAWTMPKAAGVEVPEFESQREFVRGWAGRDPRLVRRRRGS